MRVPSGKVDQKIAFVALDATDRLTRETGLSGFTVYRSRNGGTPTAYTTPTIAELDATNMPGVYTLLVDEDTTIGANSDSEEYLVHITCTGMDPVTRSIELYRNEVDGKSVIQVLRGLAAIAFGKVSGLPGAPVFRSLDDTADRVSATTDGTNGNRSAVTLNL